MSTRWRAAALLLALTPDAAAHETIGATWDHDVTSVPYRVAGDLSGFGEDAALAAIQAGLDAWSEAPCGPLAFVYDGRLDDPAWGEIDGASTVAFFTEGWPEDPALISAPALAISGAEIVEADMALNGEDYAWAVDGADGLAVMDLQSVVTHEAGHWLGLWHSEADGAALDPSTIGHPDARELGEDDLEGLCALYSGDGPGAIGATCEEAEDCAEALCLTDGTERYCTETCAADVDCPGGYVCLPAEGVEVCARGEDPRRGCGATPAPIGAPGPLGLAGLLGLARRRRGRRRGPQRQCRLKPRRRRAIRQLLPPRSKSRQQRGRSP